MTNLTIAPILVIITESSENMIYKKVCNYYKSQHSYISLSMLDKSLLQRNASENLFCLVVHDVMTINYH